MALFVLQADGQMPSIQLQLMRQVLFVALLGMALLDRGLLANRPSVWRVVAVVQR